jgi:hypothetical protein
MIGAEMSSNERMGIEAKTQIPNHQVFPVRMTLARRLPAPQSPASIRILQIPTQRPNRTTSRVEKICPRKDPNLQTFIRILESPKIRTIVRRSTHRDPSPMRSPATDYFETLEKTYGPASNLHKSPMGWAVGLRHDPLHAPDFSIASLRCDQETKVAAPWPARAHSTRHPAPIAIEAHARIPAAGISYRTGRSSSRATVGRLSSAPAHCDSVAMDA